MKLLFDQNLSPHLVTKLNNLFPGSVHVQDIGLSSSKDTDIWEYAKNNEFIIVTKDADFAERSLVMETSPKIIWIKRGNCTTRYIEELLKSNYEQVNLLNEEIKSNVLYLF